MITGSGKNLDGNSHSLSKVITPAYDWRDSGE
jgi:hypothetical protein